MHTWRKSNDADEPHLRAMMHALYAEDPSTVPMTDAKITRTLETLAAEPARGLALVCDAPASSAGGYALLCSFWSNELGGEVCVVDELYVAPAQRGRGLATELVRALAAGATPWFPHAVAYELEVTPDNARARALYERLGFKPYKNALLRLHRTP